MESENETQSSKNPIAVEPVIPHKPSFTFRDECLEEIDLRVPRTVSFNKMSEEILVENMRDENIHLTDLDYQIASTLIRDAMHGRNMNFKTDAKSLRSYEIFQNPYLKLILSVCCWLIIGLTVFERPYLYEAPVWATMIVELCILMYFLFRFIHHSMFEVRRKFWRDPKNITIFLSIILNLLDMGVYTILLAFEFNNPIRCCRILRPLFLVNIPEGRQIRKAFRSIRKTLPDVVYVMILLYISITIFTLMAIKLFPRHKIENYDESLYMSNFLDSFWDLYVLVTTANNPDVMMPAYNYSSWYSIFFIVYLLINLYLFMSIVLAVIYNNYKKHLKEDVISSVYIKRKSLGRAFDLLKVWKNGRYVVVQDRWHTLMKFIDPRRSETQNELLLFVLDSQGDGSINRIEFLKVADLLNVSLVEMSYTLNIFEKYCSRVYDSVPSVLLRNMVVHPGFKWFFDIMILANAFFMFFYFMEKSEWFFISAFIIEIVLKLYTYGFKKFLRSYWNLFDSVIVFLALIAIIYQSIRGALELEHERALDFILVFRVLRLIRIMHTLPQFRVTLSTCLNIIPSICTYGCVLFVVYYIYAIVGMEIFHGKIEFDFHNLSVDKDYYCNNPKLKDSEFVKDFYCKNNFNNFVSSFLLLFNLMVVNQWHILTKGYVLVTHKAARLYFATFHVITVVILLNIVTAFILEAFILEYELSSTELETAVEVKIKEMGLTSEKSSGIKLKTGDKIYLFHENESTDDLSVPPEQEESSTPSENNQINANASEIINSKLKTNIRFKIQKRGLRKIEVLLQKMFENEIDPSDEGPECADLENYNFPNKARTFSAF